MALAGSLVATGSAKTADFEAGMRKMRSELTQTRAVADGVSQGFASLGRSVGALALGAVSLGAIKSGIEGIVRTGLDMERLRNSFTAITGSVQASRAEFQFISATANRLGLDVQGLADSYRGLAAATRGTALAGADTRELFTALTQASRAYGLSTDETGRALQAVQQIISKGKVSQEELRQQLGEALPGASQIAARAFGVTTAELDKMIEKGIPAAEFIRKFTAQLQKEAPVAADLAGAGFTRLGNEIAALQDRIAQSGLLRYLDQAANKAAQLLNIFTQQDEALKNAVLGRLGAAANLATPDELRKLQELAAAVNKTPQTVFTGRGAFVVGEQAQARQQLEAQILAISKRRAGATGEGELGEEGPERFGRRLQANQALLAQQREQDKAKTLNDYNAILNREDARVKAEEEGARKTKIAATEGRKAQQDAEADNRRHADQRVTLFRQVLDQQDQYLQQLQDEKDRHLLSEDAIARKELASKAFGAVEDDLRRQKAEGLLKELQIIREIEAAFEDERESQRALAKEQEEQAKTLEKIRERNDKQIQEEEKKRDRELRDQTKQFADFFTDTILSATDIGKRGFRDFADSVIADLQRILVRQYLAPQLSGAVDKGIQLGLQLLGLGASALSGANIAPALQASGTVDTGGFAFGERASGGPVMSNRAYLVGEQGPELFVPGQSGNVMPNGALGGVTIYGPLLVIQTPDAGSFQRSQGELGARYLQLTQRAMGRNG